MQNLSSSGQACSGGKKATGPRAVSKDETVTNGPRSFESWPNWTKLRPIRSALHKIQDICWRHQHQLPTGQTKKIFGNVLYLQTHDHPVLFEVSCRLRGQYRWIFDPKRLPSLGLGASNTGPRRQKWVIRRMPKVSRAVVVWAPFYNIRWIKTIWCIEVKQLL